MPPRRLLLLIRPGRRRSRSLPATAELAALGETVQLRAEVRDQNGQVMAGVSVTWASSSAAVATVSASGLVTAAGNGTATITASAGGASGTATATVAQEVSTVALTPPAETLVAGDTLRLTAEAADANGHPAAGAEFDWASSDTLVAVVDDAGLVTGVGAGEAEVTATAAGVTGRAALTVLAPGAHHHRGHARHGGADGTRSDRATQRGSARPDRACDRGCSRVLVERRHDHRGGRLGGSVDGDGRGVRRRSRRRAGEASGEAVVTVMQRAGSVVVSPSLDTVALGDTLRLAAEAFDENGHRVEEAEFRWLSSEVSVATVDGSGLVTGVAEGAVTITATAGNAQGTAQITVANPDRPALVALYNATDGPNWLNNENWLTDAPLGEWYGVDVDGQGRVTRLDFAVVWNPETQELESNNLIGPIPSALGNLSRLEHLSLRSNALRGEIPPELGNLSSLRFLHLGENALGGPIPKELANLSQLRHLALDRNALSGLIPAALGTLPYLSHLNLDFNRITGPIPTELGTLSKLENLRLQGNALSGPIPAELGNLASLRRLWLNLNVLEGPIPPELSKLSNLRDLALNGNRLTGPIPPEFGRLTGLRALSLDDNALTGPIPRSLLQLVKLGWFRFEENDGLCAPGTTEFTDWLDGMNAPEGPFCNESDVAVLESLYEATAGADWTNSASWLGDGAISEWHGVSADALGHVTGLDLSRNGLTGRLPPTVSELARMAELRINGNALSGRLPLSLARLSLLELHYGDTELCTPPDGSFQEWLGSIPSHSGTGVECPPLSDRDILVALYEATDGANWARSDNWLTDNPLSTWYGVWTDQGGGTPQQQTEPTPDTSRPVTDHRPPDTLALDSAGPVVKGWPVQDTGPQDRVAAESLGWRPVASMADGNVVHLYLGWNNLTGAIPGELGNLPRLEQLSLRSNDLTGSIPPELGNLASLERLNLRNNDLSGAIPGELGNLANLDSLTLYFNELSGPIPPQLGRLASLRFLGLDGNPRLGGSIPPELGNLAHLEKLRLVRTGLHGPIPPELGDLSGLKEMHLWWNELTGEIPPELGSLSSLKVLSLGDNSLTGPIPPELGNLSTLESLSLTRNNLTGPIPGALANLSGLEVLALGGNSLTEIPPEFSTFSSLKELYLWGNHLAGPIPPELGNVASLEILYLNNADLTGPIPPELDGLARLLELHVEGNAGMSGALSVRLAALGRLKVLLTAGTDLCVPADVPRLQRWLGGVEKHRVSLCGAAVAYLTQAVQSREFPVPLVAGERSLLRVFVTATSATAESIPPVRASFYLNGAETHVVDIPGQSTAIPTDVDEGALSMSANIEIPGEVVQPGLEMMIEIDPMGTLDPELVVTRRIPETGRASVRVKAMPKLDLTLIPFLWRSEPDSSILETIRGMAADPERHELLWHARTLLPVGALDVKAHEPVLVWANSPLPISPGLSLLLRAKSASALLLATRWIRVIEGGGGHYLGMMPPPLEGVATGIAYAPGRSSFSIPEATTIAHELGHNLSLQHAPCKDPAGPDPSFPSPDGSVGAWGYDFRDGGSLVSPYTADLMSYCDPRWISDYHFGRALRFRGSEADSTGLPDVAAPAKSLLLLGGVDTDGDPFLEPAFVIDAPPALPQSRGEYEVTGLTATGGELFSLSFDMPEVADGDGSSGFAFALPVELGWEGNLATIALSGPGGSATLDGTSDRPLAILRNPQTGQVRGILRDVPTLALAQAARDAAEQATGPSLEVLFSRGIPDAASWRR